MLRLTFDDQGTQHGDILLECGDYARHVDSYFFGLDPAVRELPGVRRVRASLEQLLDQWLVAVRDAAPDQSVFLPFEFADEYTGWLRVTVEGDRVRCRPGWSAIPGHAVYPSKIELHVSNVADFDPIPDAEDLVVSQVALCEAIELNRADVIDLHPAVVVRRLTELGLTIPGMDWTPRKEKSERQKAEATGFLNDTRKVKG